MAGDNHTAEQWIDEYRREFIAFATNRPDWSPERATAWANGEVVEPIDLPLEEYIRLGASPVDMARAGVIEAEWIAANGWGGVIHV